MKLLEEIYSLTKLEEDILLHGKINKEEPNNERNPFEDKDGRQRLKMYHFYELQDKYTYGWYIAEESQIEQVRSIGTFKKYIIDNYKEDGETLCG